MTKRSNRYDEPNHNCQKVGMLYDRREHRVYKASCNSISCGRCRQREIRKMLNKVTTIAKDKNLTRHLVITVPGKTFRKFVDADESFDYFSYAWQKFRVMFKREYGDNLQYIAFRRAQKDGYCHMHALVDRYIPVNKINDISRRAGLGYASINFVDVHRITSYLSKYWYKDHEWLIPKGMRHITTSRGIKLSDGVLPEDKLRILAYKMDVIFINHFNEDAIYDIVECFSGGYPPPLDFLLSQAYGG